MLSDIQNTDGLCWTFCKLSKFTKTQVMYCMEDCFPEVGMFAPPPSVCWWFPIPIEEMDDGRICRLIVLDFAIEMLKSSELNL